MDIKLVDNNGLLWAFYVDPPQIGIDNLFKWYEEFLTISLTHEIIHLVLWKLENYDTAKAFDNLFGLIDPSVILVPEEELKIFKIYKERTENLWKRLKKRR